MLAFRLIARLDVPNLTLEDEIGLTVASCERASEISRKAGMDDLAEAFNGVVIATLNIRRSLMGPSGDIDIPLNCQARH